MMFDTTVYSALARGTQSAIDALNGVPELTLPLPAIAELRYGFLKGSQRDRNEHMLQRFLAQPQVTIAAPSIKTTEVYAELQLHCSKRGRVLSHNDIWIAALASEANDVLVTYDRDFAVFSNLFDDRLIILE